VKVTVLRYNNIRRKVEFKLTPENDGERALLGAMATNPAKAEEMNESGLTFFVKVN